jgi:tRNA 2-selenouridine synthase
MNLLIKSSKIICKNRNLYYSLLSFSSNKNSTIISNNINDVTKESSLKSNINTNIISILNNNNNNNNNKLIESSTLSLSNLLDNDNNTIYPKGMKLCNINEFINKDYLVIDVRSPKEYEKGHIKGSINISLFSDVEREIIGTIYKKDSIENAKSMGLKYVGPKLIEFLDKVKASTNKTKIYVYCARGGMRSRSFAWLFKYYGDMEEVCILKGGYKTYRHFALNEFKQKKLLLTVVSGPTGCKKTLLLHEKFKNGEQIIDLEGLAKHKGSVFGDIGQNQPTQEQFENDLAYLINNLDSNKQTWIEDESRKIGKIVIPEGLWLQMLPANRIVIEKSKKERIEFLLEDYKLVSNNILIESLKRIQKHLGGERYNYAISLLNNNDRENFCIMMIDYYDKAYYFSSHRRNEKIDLDKK